MTRILFPLVLLALAAGMSGCRMCGSPDDYCIPAYIERDCDYRGCDTLYRAGSIFYDNVDYRSVSDPDCNDCSMSNAGDWGKTKAVKPFRNIGVPPKAPDANENGFEMPTREELMRGVRPGLGVPETVPTDDEPGTERISPPPTRPFTPIGPTGPIDPSAPVDPAFPFSTQSGEPKITVEELRRLDPTITDVQILNIDDSLNTSLPNDSRTTWQ